MTYQPYTIFGADRPGRWLITCDHASNFVPLEINGGDLGIGPADMNRHIAYDIGARGTSLILGELLNSPVICSNFSRLVIDPNRGADDPTLVMRLYDGTIIPANRHVDAQEVQRRIDAYYRPYHDALADLAAAREDIIIIAMHSFSPRLNGRAPRPWEIGVLHAAPEDRFAPPLIQRLQEETDLTVGDNEPYAGHLAGDSMDQHALHQGRLNALIELRQDVIASEEGQAHWAERLAAILTDTINRTSL
ncbi:N-formylglutamate amidohydrolase [Shimia abyssi]|uniref:Putative N-formylglutamate amidohydrolase n=1 Tax=Shimia abyssi TaxID=1662395 RepID=A0A2P8FBK8_9RHOB|nr:N-formylglutamate amidohydrolase [Shimia abyssi]PSL19090.1 putative N-formylglutamate amidohydrolase [Shimia abyssi]